MKFTITLQGQRKTVELLEFFHFKLTSHDLLSPGICEGWTAGITNLGCGLVSNHVTQGMITEKVRQLTWLSMGLNLNQPISMSMNNLLYAETQFWVRVSVQMHPMH